MARIRISQLPPATALKGLRTLATDKDGHSVSVSFEQLVEEAQKVPQQGAVDLDTPIYTDKAGSGHTLRELFAAVFDNSQTFIIE